MISKEERKTIEAKAWAAPKHRRKLYGANEIGYPTLSNNRRRITTSPDFDGIADAEFIAVTDAFTVLDLLNMLEVAEAQNGLVKKAQDTTQRELEYLRERNKQLEKENADRQEKLEAVDDELETIIGISRFKYKNNTLEGMDKPFWMSRFIRWERLRHRFWHDYKGDSCEALGHAEMVKELESLVEKNITISSGERKTISDMEVWL